MRRWDAFPKAADVLQVEAGLLDLVDDELEVEERTDRRQWRCRRWTDAPTYRSERQRSFDVLERDTLEEPFTDQPTVVGSRSIRGVRKTGVGGENGTDVMALVHGFIPG